MLRVLVITNLFPNAARPQSAPFNRQQFSALNRLCSVEVLATIPWFPAQAWLAGLSETDIGTGIPRRETIDGLPVHHPRTLHIPKVGGIVGAPLFAASLLPRILKYRKRVDVVLASWAYPDGCAAIALGELLRVPVVVKLHGSDINIVSRMPGPRRYMRRLLPRAAAIVSVSRALSQEVARLGVAKARVHQVMNGVDPALFRVRDRESARAKVQVPPEQRVLLCVANLKKSKGVLDLRDAFESIAADNPDLHLYMIGDGHMRAELEASAAKLSNLHILGARPLSEIPQWMAACDALVLPSWDEGTPNVVLEALACGRRVIATKVGGVPDLLGDPLLGAMIPARDVGALAEALSREARKPYDALEVAGRGSRGDWAQSAASLYEVLQDAAARGVPLRSELF